MVAQSVKQHKATTSLGPKAAKTKHAAKPPALTQFEKDRLKRVEENMRRMMECGVLQAAAALQQTLADDKAKAAAKRRAALPRVRRQVAPEDLRKSARLQSQPAKSYCEPTDKIILERGCSKNSKSGKSCGKRYDGLEAAMPTSGPLAWYTTPRGWKPSLGCASLAAAEAATEAAMDFVKQLRRKGRFASVKIMTDSQVSKGCWSHMTSEMTSFFRRSTDKSDIILFSRDQEMREHDELWYSHKGSTTWSVVLCRHSGSSFGLSGGWRGFAYDHMLTPNDTVVLEVLDNAEFQQLYDTAEAEAAQARAAAKQAAAAAAAAVVEGDEVDAPEGGAGVAPAVTAAAAAAAGVGGNSSEAEESEAAGAGAAGASSCDAGSEEGEGAAAGEGGKKEAEVEEEEADGEGSRLPPLVYSDAPSARTYIRAYIFRAHNYEKPKEDGSEQQQGAAEVAGSQPQAAAAASPAAADNGAAATEAADSDGAARQDRSTRRAAKPAAAGAAQGPRSTKQQQAAGPAGGRKRKQQEEVQEEDDDNKTVGSGQRKRTKTAAAAAAAADKKAGKQQGKKAAAAAGGGGGRKSSSSKSAAGDGLVKQPANPKALVPGPTDEEVERDAAGGPFVVERIMEHKVEGKGHQDKFLIRWEGFGPYWDSWEGLECLDQPPHTYTWQGGKKAVPAKFKPKK